MKLFLNIDKKLIAESIRQTTPQVPLDEIDDIANSLDANIAKDVKIPKDVLDSFKLKDSLAPEIWIKEKLNEKVKLNLLKIADDFYKELDLPQQVKIKDIIFTGSLANFNWSKFSDIDLHIVLDFSQFKADPKMVEDYFYAKKAMWNQEHDINVFNYPIEIYVQDVKANLRATAIYSVLNDKWILKPNRENFKLDKNAIKEKANKIIDNLRHIRQQYNDKHFQNVVDMTTKLKEKIRNMRNAGLEEGGEFSLENLVFKVLRRTSFMDQLDSFKAKAYDTLMSVSETINETLKRKELIRESLNTLAEANDRYATKRDYYTALFKRAKVKELYGGDEYWENIQDGQFVGTAIVNIHGYLRVTTNIASARDVRRNDMGMKETPHYLQFTVMAGRGIEHPDTYSANKQPARTRQGMGSEEFENTLVMNLPQGISLENGETKIKLGIPKPGSPASDAEIKTWLSYGDVIIEFIESNMKDRIGYNDTKGADISKEKMAANPNLLNPEKTKANADLKLHLGRPPSQAEIADYMESGILPQKQIKTLVSPQDKEREERERKSLERIAKAKARQRNL